MHGQTILLVEDQPDVRDMIEMSLGDLDYRILTAVDGKAARQVLQSDEAIDLLLTDIVMPNGVCGLEIGKIGKRSTASATGARGCRRVGLPPRLRNQADHESGLIFLEKRCRPTDLADTIADVLSGGRK